MDPLWTSAGIVLAAFLLARLRSSLRPPLPPGPRGYPVIGNLLEWPTSKEWLTFTRWGELYGDIVHLNMAGTHVMILNSPEATSKILDAKSANYSDRPYFHFIHRMVGWDQTTGSMDDGPILQEQRRLIAQEIGSKNSLQRFGPLLEAQNNQFLQRLLDQPSPKLLLGHIRKLASSIILDITYGYQVKPDYDEFVEMIERALRDFSQEAKPGKHMVDIFPWLDRLPSWFPGTSWRRGASTLRQELDKCAEVPYEEVKRQMTQGTARPSFVLEQLEKRDLTPKRNWMIKWTAGSLYAAGADTTVSSLYAFFLYMTIYPEVQAKARAELDAVIGPDRLPSLKDREQLPYMNALIKEVFRCGLVVPQGLPHKARANDIHDGYLIPRGSLIMTNIWFILHDPRRYKDPDVFEPSRFLGENPEPDPRDHVFGYGRRACSGQQLAETSVFLACATSLAALQISRERDTNNVEIIPKAEFESGILSRPKPFVCSIKARSKLMEEFVQSSLDV